MALTNIHGRKEWHGPVSLRGSPARAAGGEPTQCSAGQWAADSPRPSNPRASSGGRGNRLVAPERHSRLPTGCSPSGQPEVDSRLPRASAVLLVSQAPSPGQRGRPGPSPDSLHWAISSVPPSAPPSVCPFAPGGCLRVPQAVLAPPRTPARPPPLSSFIPRTGLTRRSSVSSALSRRLRPARSRRPRPVSASFRAGGSRLGGGSVSNGAQGQVRGDGRTK